MKVHCWALTMLLGGSPALAADVTFNIDYISEADPTPGSTTRHCGDLWAEGDYAYIGSDRVGGGIAIFDVSNPASPEFVTEYEGNEMEDVEVYNGIGYFSSDVNTVTPTTPRTGVDIVDLSDPANPALIIRIDPLAFPQAHGKVHTLSVSDGFLYTTDNATEIIKVFDVSNPASPQFVRSIDLQVPGSMASHEVMVKNSRMYVASKNNSDAVNGYADIYDVSNIGTTGPVFLKRLNTGGGTHTAMPSEDGDMLVVAQERSNGDVRIYDISMIDQPNDPDNPPTPITINRTTFGIDALSPHHAHMHGDLLFISWYEAGLQVFNVADRTKPVWVGAFDTFTGGANNFSGNWGVFPDLGLDRLLLSDRERGLIIVDASGVEPTGDFNADGSVDGADFLAWQRGFGLSAGATLAQGDGNRDRAVNGIDLALWRTHLGEGSGHGHAAPVPECATIWMVVTCALVLRGLRSRR